MAFDYAIPKSTWAPTAPPLRGPDGQIVPTFKKVRTCPRSKSLGDRNRRHIKVTVHDGVEYTYHATKGWRARKV
jgi:hypothetical protein